jgi:arsenate reductase
MRVLFLCTHNSARSQLGEALLRHLAGSRIDVYSAGTEPTTVRPETRQVLAEMGIRHEGRSKHLDEFAGQEFDHVITTCDEAQEACPVWPGANMIHWNFPDPSASPPDERMEAFRAVRDELLQRLQRFVNVQLAS